MGFIDSLDLSYILLDSLRDAQFHMNGIALNIRNMGFTLIIDGYCLKYIEYSVKENSLILETPSVSLLDLIDELYPSRYDVDEVLNGDWADTKFINKMIRKYPKAFESYVAERKIVDELARKYDLDFKLIVDPEAQMYARLLWRGVMPNMQKINGLLSKGVMVFEERCNMVGITSLEESCFKRNLQLIESILNYLDIIKDLYILIKDTKIKIEKIEVSNSVDILSTIRPRIEIELDISSRGGLGIIISEDEKVNLKLILHNGHIERELESLFNSSRFILDKEEPKTYTKIFLSVKKAYKWIKDKLLPQIL